MAEEERKPYFVDTSGIAFYNDPAEGHDAFDVTLGSEGLDGDGFYLPSRTLEGLTQVQLSSGDVLNKINYMSPTRNIPEMLKRNGRNDQSLQISLLKLEKILREEINRVELPL